MLIVKFNKRKVGCIYIGVLLIGCKIIGSNIRGIRI